MPPRKSMPLNPEETLLFQSMWRFANTPAEQFLRRPAELAEFTKQWNELTGRSDTCDEVHHAMTTRRKWNKDRPGRLEALGPGHKKLRVIDDMKINAYLKELLITAYFEVETYSDSLSFTPESRTRLESRFHELSGTFINGLALVAILIDMRKHGELPKLSKKPKKKLRRPFGDADAIDG